MSNDNISRITLDENLVVEWLEHHPDLLARHPDLLRSLEVPDDNAGDAVSLIERQVRVLREQIENMQTNFDHMVSTARENEMLQERLHSVSLAVASAAGFDQALVTISDLLRKEFDIEHVCISFAESHGSATPTSDGWKLLHDRVGRGKSICDDRLPARALEMLFGAAATTIGSAAVIPLPEASGDGSIAPDALVYGMIGLGSEDATRFDHAMGTLYLDRLGQLVSTGLHRLKRSVAAA